LSTEVVAPSAAAAHSPSMKFLSSVAVVLMHRSYQPPRPPPRRSCRPGQAGPGAGAILTNAAAGAAVRRAPRRAAPPH
jgi:hypothetical protein